MKKRFHYRFTARALSVLTVLSLTAACSSPAAENSANGNTQGEAGQKLTSIKVFSELGSWASQSIKNYGENLVFQEMEKKTGVKVNWVHPPAGQSKEQFNLMIASNDLPDVIMYDWFSAPGGIKKYVDDGVIRDLTPYMNEKAPNFMKLMNENPEAKKQSMDDSSKFYCMPMLRLTDSLRVTDGPQARMDWLDKLNLKKPTTIDDWYNVLKALKAQNPSGWPMTGQKFVGTNGIGNLVGAWGISYDFYMDGNTVKYGPTNPKFKEALTFINKLFSEGLIDPDYMLNNREKQDAKVTGGSSGVLFGVQPSNFMRTMVESGRDPNFRMEGIPWPTGSAGKAYSLSSSYTYEVTAPCAAISKTAKNPEQIVAWLDYAYGQEGNLLFNLGLENMTYVMKDGKAENTDLINKNKDGLSSSAALGKYTMGLNGWAMAQDVQYHRQLMMPYGYPAADNWRTADVSLIVPRLTLTAEEAQQASRLKTDIDTYAHEMFDKFTSGKEPLANYDKFTQRLKDMGIEQLTKIYQDAFERYQMRGK
ncbi:putative aldouronate transport system substrate-binding protein [Paenibacillus sp. UNCCL117]|uniref:extracellular solute-binding protein n=1 Tax=unclassified Paenibacillus TaxID=185978 RepID=UPI00088479DC|nr:MULTISPECIES: extracellular solute-binding protein [unclassified Paenibacillus]SDD70104.1 putative aldouronate transport system substrate-binding protein [Paenibacillus sp. cl123]SFW45270.1 putative aldouronate transport system substrate-binding protein [Paenibacillus sp. UNCCL117]